MRKFRVVVNGEVFEVEVEEVAAPANRSASVAVGSFPVAAMSGSGAGATSPKPVGGPVGSVGPGVATATPPEAAAGRGATAGRGTTEVLPGEAVRAPLPGVIADVKVSVGQEVAAGDVLLVLEAMKMENEISSPVAGVVRQVLVERGTSVNAGDPMVVVGR